MVNPGKPSNGCLTCKTRKIKCDEAVPACSQCIKAGWTCPGSSSRSSMVFRNQTPSEMAAKSMSAWKRVVLPPTRDIATTFFIQQYTYSCESNSSAIGTHEYLPNLMRSSVESNLGLLGTVVAATGFAALSNTTNAPPWRAEAFRLYNQAVHQLRDTIESRPPKVSDHTLGAILVMGTFEIVAGADVTSMKSYSNHIMAAARCIDWRGPQQFVSVEAVKLFMHTRRIMITTCHQLQEPVQYDLAKWSRWAASAQSDQLRPVNRFSEINERLAQIRAEIKYQSIRDPSIVSAQLLPIDRMLEEWASTLPESWIFKSYRSGLDEVSRNPYDSQCDMYTDPWIACVWNCYRNVRLLIHESIIAATIRHGTEEQKNNLHSSAKVLASMADGICHSVAYHLGEQRCNGAIGYPRDRTGSERCMTPGGFLLVWPLFFAGMLRTSSAQQRDWVAKKLEQIGDLMGLHLAKSMAKLLRGKELSFSHQDTFLIGEWHPN